MKSHEYDVIIAGGGPAGSTVAALVKTYTPQLRVLLLEKAHFPRHHVGESLLAGASPVLREMGAYDAVNAYGFPEKLGATYVWGRDRQPWGFEFDQVVARLVAQGKTLPDLYTKGWQVRRAEYDHLLLKRAAQTGVEVREGAAVRRVLRAEAGGRVTGVEYSDDQGLHTANSQWLMDCTGQDALLGHALDLREYDERMNNYALFGYWRGGKWKVEYVGHPHLTRIFIATTPRGWIWYIPVSREVISVGFVTHRQTLSAVRDADRLYQEEVAACPEIGGLLDNAELVRLSPDQTRDVVAIQDWSYTSRQIAGEGWAMAGDAAGFVDPILSSGVMLAHELGQKAAYTINSAFHATSDAQIKAYWDFYQETYRTYLNAYREMAAFWYGNNFSMESWWWQARRSLAESGNQSDLSEREAFNRLASGYANRAESLSLFGSYPLHEAQKLVDGLFGKSGNETDAILSKYMDRPLSLRPAVRLVNGMYFFQGLIRTTKRVTVSGTKQHLDLHPGEEALVRLLDGTHTLADLNQAADQMRALEQRMPVRMGTELVIQLDEIGALA